MKFRNYILILIVSLVMATSFSSCMTTTTSVGKYKEMPGEEYKYASGKQMWVFWGIVPLGRTDVSTPADGNCEITTKYTFSDLLISGLTGGILTSYTIKVKAKK